MPSNLFYFGAVNKKISIAAKCKIIINALSFAQSVSFRGLLATQMYIKRQENEI